MSVLDETYEERVEQVIAAFQKARPRASFIAEYPELFRALAYLEAHSRIAPRKPPRRGFWRR